MEARTWIRDVPCRRPAIPPSPPLQRPSLFLVETMPWTLLKLRTVAPFAARSRRCTCTRDLGSPSLKLATPLRRTMPIGQSEKRTEDEQFEKASMVHNRQGFSKLDDVR